MLTEKDRIVLTNTVGKRGTTLQVMHFCAIPLFLLLAGIKLWMVGLWANLGGYSLQRFLALWIDGVSAHKTYAGYLIKAGDDMTLCMLYLGAALIMGVIWWQGRAKREQAQRIVNALKRTGSW